MSATAEDYLWVEDDETGLIEAYCLTLAEGLSPDEVLARWNAVPYGRLRGLSALFEPAFGISDHETSELFTGVTSVKDVEGGGWALSVEVNGYIGVSIGEVLSTGTRVVAHSCNVNGFDQFELAEDGVLKVYFEPLIPDQRHGSAPDVLLDEMRAVGLPFDASDDLSLHRARVFALAERLTGVRVTPVLLEEADYLCGLVRIP
ncbi:DUF6461 domain-containing protein [Actinomadura rupiterrae]|uniref:DUF6461 domain-containing protein n=1 Tax=Actinomadura rupiterrae TaxID=559627 RepID=UPI0020A5FDAF|nr:DUF6461 domain-containing protein [Actinomadura rupiterrae]MCP2335885.1 hypothetical protein [Actinomadura rupiterrae]